MSVFVNFSNHPSTRWNGDQKEAAEKYGDIVDVQFPLLGPDLSEKDIKKIGDECIAQIIKYSPVAVMCQGEFTLTFYVVSELLRKGITCVSACTRRVSNETMLEDGTVRKESLFVFDGFRKYI